MVNKSIISLTLILLFLAWVGWRFFIPRSTINTAPESLSAAPVQTRDLAGSTHVSRDRLFKPRWFKWFVGWLWLATLLVALTIFAVLAFSGRISLDPLQALDFQRQKHIHSALSPEKLVPPPPLPPSLFVNSGRPALETADRDWSRLHPDFVQTVLQVFERMKARGYPLALLEGYRSPERQDTLAGLGAQVTNAKAFESKHQYGLALDAAPFRDGRLVISEQDPWAQQAYQALGEEAERAGLVWGGRWKLRDYGHIEAIGSISEGLKKK
jgi:peptidoglycan L-alanyl-D-glutamate endopeptidase CwlK